MLLISLLISLSSCFGGKEVFFVSGQTMGTTYSIKIASKQVDTLSLKLKVEDTLREVNRQMSTYIPTSEISRVNSATKDELIEISPWFKKVLTYSLDLAEKTGGFYDPTLGPLINLWGFGPKGRREVPEKEKIKEALAVVGYKRLSVVKEQDKILVKKELDGVYVDLSSSAKGFGVDMLSELLVKEGYLNHLVEIGGELRSSGTKFNSGWKVAVEKPSSGEKNLQMVVPLKDISIATSGDYRNFFNAGNKKYSHTLDVKTGEPVQHKLVSVSVLDKECMKADALATALMSLGPEKAKKYALDNNLAVYLVFEGADAKLQTFESPSFNRLKSN
ncbi:MAG: FAD:protein FMN transferase [Bdellovibrionales bacterium]